MKIEKFLKNLYKKQEKQHELNKEEHAEKQERLIEKIFNTEDNELRKNYILQLREDTLDFKEYKQSYETTQLIIKALMNKKE